MKVFFKCVVLLLLSVFWGCVEHPQKTDKGTIIEIDGFNGRKLNLSDFVSSVENYKLETDSFFIGDVADLCVYDSTLYVLDGLTSNLIAYDLHDRSVSVCINGRGDGPYEYVRPQALTVDGEGLYLLDSSVQKIICYNHSLKPVHEIKVGFSALDFIKVKEGFLLCTVLPEPSLAYKKIIYVDMDGNIKDSYVHTHQFGMTLGKNFVKDVQNEIFVTIPYSNQIYRWEQEELHSFCYTDFGGLNIPDEERVEDLSLYDMDYLHNNNFFVTSSYFINAFLYDNKMHYHFKEHATGQVYSGRMVDEMSGLPFFPRWQYKNSLIGICRLEELSEDTKIRMKVGNEEEGLVALFFVMK